MTANCLHKASVSATEPSAAPTSHSHSSTPPIRCSVDKVTYLICLSPEGRGKGLAPPSLPSCSATRIPGGDAHQHPECWGGVGLDREPDFLLDCAGEDLAETTETSFPELREMVGSGWALLLWISQSSGPLNMTTMGGTGLCLEAIKDLKAAPPHSHPVWPGCHCDAPVAPEAAAGP